MDEREAWKVASRRLLNAGDWLPTCFHIAYYLEMTRDDGLHRRGRLVMIGTCGWWMLVGGWLVDG